MTGDNDELPDPIFCSSCPECGAYPLEESTYEIEDDTVFLEDCPNCHYVNRF